MSLDKFGRGSFPRSAQMVTVRSGFSHTPTDDIDVGHLKMCNVKLPTDVADVANKQYVDEVISQIKLDFKIAFDNYGEKIRNYLAGFSNEIIEERKRVDVHDLKLTSYNTNFVQLSGIVHKINIHVEQLRNNSLPKLKSDIDLNVKNILELVDKIDNTVKSLHDLKAEQQHSRDKERQLADVIDQMKKDLTKIAITPKSTTTPPPPKRKPPV